jgi:predicted DNA-binding antitoxin AbrB/MazE fold protein
MSKQIEAIDENGGLRRLQSLDLDESERVTITMADDGEGEEDLCDLAETWS